MPADPPFIIPNARPFKVEATPSKMGGVDALAKRPLDMSGKAEPLTDHLTSVEVEAPPADTWVTLPPDADGDPGGEGPVLQEQIDTSHREYFDDPSRYLRTDGVVKLPGTGLARDETPTQSTVKDTPTLTDATLTTEAATSRPRVARRAKPQACKTQQAGESRADAAPPVIESGDPHKRRDAFNERLANILARQQHIHEELSAVEQAVQATRATLKPDLKNATDGKDGTRDTS